MQVQCNPSRGSPRVRLVSDVPEGKSSHICGLFMASLVQVGGADSAVIILEGVLLSNAASTCADISQT